MPGLQLDAGELLIDESRLVYPGDVLHEGGHMAVAPPGARPLLSGDAEVPGPDMEALEHAVLPWSYAAALHLADDPARVFHSGGYRGRSQGLLRTFGFDVLPGCAPARGVRHDGDGTASGGARRAAVPAYAPLAPSMTKPLDQLSVDDFTPRVGEAFEVDLGDQGRIPLTLASTEERPTGTSDLRAPFSLLFRGPCEPALPQMIYPVANAELGRLEIFLVPVGPQGDAMRYEAVFG